MTNPTVNSILPAKKVARVAAEVPVVDFYNMAINECAAAIERANLVIMPKEEELKLLIYKLSDRDHSKGVDFKVALGAGKLATAIIKFLKEGKQ